LLRRQAVPPGNLGNDRAWSKRLFNHPRLKGFNEPAPSTSPRDHLQPVNGRHFRLKLMVKESSVDLKEQPHSGLLLLLEWDG
jgi:hypothetical protein